VVRKSFTTTPIRSFEEDRAPKPTEMAKIIVSLLAREGVECDLKTAQKLYTQIVELVLRCVITYGRMALPYGWGSFKLRVMYAGKQRPVKVPGQDRMVMRQPRPIIRYDEGTSVRSLLGLKNYLTHSTELRYGSALPDEFMPPAPPKREVESSDAPPEEA